MSKTALILIDIQNIYFTEGNYLLSKPEEAAKKAKDILEYFRKEKMPVIHIKHLFKTDAYKEDSEFLNDIHRLVYPLENEKVIEKKFPNSFLNTGLQDYLTELQVEKLVVVGMMSHMCVDTTVRACQNYGYEVTVIADACTTKALQWNGIQISPEMVHGSYMAGLNGMFAKVILADEFDGQKSIADSDM